MPYGLPPPPMPNQMPISPYAPQMQQTPQLAPPPTQFIDQNDAERRAKMKEAGKQGKFNPLSLILPALGVGIGALGKGNFSNFGLGVAQGSSNQLLQNQLELNRRDAEQEDNTIKNVHAQMDKVRRLGDPRFQEITQAYDQAMADGKMTGKEASKLQQSLMGVGDIEQALKNKDQQDQLDFAVKKYRAEDSIRKENNIKANIGGQDLSLTPDQYADYMTGKDRATAAEAAATTRQTAAQKAEDARQGRFLEAQDRMDARAGRRRDERFMGKLDTYISANASVDAIEKQMDNFINTSMLHPIDKAKAGASLRDTVNGFSTNIGRELGEKGVFTDADRTVFTSVIYPGLLRSIEDPTEAHKYLNQLKGLMKTVKEREITNYGLVNPESPLLSRLQAQDLPPQLATPPIPNLSKRPPALREPQKMDALHGAPNPFAQATQ